MKYYKKAIAGVLLAVMFTSTTAYAGFTDVPNDAWYAEDVETVQSLGIMQGTGNNSFNPNGTLSYGEAIAIIAKIHAMKHNKEIPTLNGEWYQGAIEYARTNNLFPGKFAPSKQPPYAPEGYTYVDMPAEPYIMASFYANALPEDEYTPINTVEMLYDVLEESSAYEDILKLYRAGILCGTGKYREYNRQAKITRAEMAAIVNRLINPDERQHFTIEQVKAPEGLSALPDKSNVSTFGTIYPKEGDIINGKVVIRDPDTGVLGFDMKGGIYLSIEEIYADGTKHPIKIGTYDSGDYDNMGVQYINRQGYLFWTREFGKLDEYARSRLPVASAEYEGKHADIKGNITTNISEAFYRCDKNQVFGDYDWNYLHN